MEFELNSGCEVRLQSGQPGYFGDGAADDNANLARRDLARRYRRRAVEQQAIACSDLLNIATRTNIGTVDRNLVTIADMQRLEPAVEAILVVRRQPARRDVIDVVGAMNDRLMDRFQPAIFGAAACSEHRKRKNWGEFDSAHQGDPHLLKPGAIEAEATCLPLALPFTGAAGVNIEIGGKAGLTVVGGAVVGLGRCSPL